MALWRPRVRLPYAPSLHPNPDKGFGFFYAQTSPALNLDFAKEVFPMRLILLDTDIGNDMDDMQALAYLLA